MAAGLGRADLDRQLSPAKRSGHPTDQVTGIGQHHAHQRQQMLLAPLQLRSPQPLQTPAGDDP